MNQYYTVDEAAKLLSITPRMLRDLLRDLLRAKQIEGLKVGNLWRVSEQAMDAFVKDNTTAAVPKLEAAKVKRPLPTRIV